MPFSSALILHLLLLKMDIIPFFLQKRGGEWQNINISFSIYSVHSFLWKLKHEPLRNEINEEEFLK